MPSSTVGTIRINFETNLQKFSRSMKKFRKVADRAIQKVATLGKIGFAGMVAAAAAATAVIVKSTARIRELSLASVQLGISAESLQRWEYAARQVGITGEELHSGLGDFAERLSEATEGTGEAAEALERLGLSAYALNKMSLDQAALVVADAMKDVTNTSDRARTAIQLFGGEVGKKMAPLMSQGADAIKAFGDEAKRLGLVISDEEVVKVGEMSKAWGDIMKIVKAIGNRLTVSVSPILTKIAEKITAWWKEGDNAKNTMDNIAEAVKIVYKFAQNIYYAFVSWASWLKVGAQYLAVGILGAIDSAIKKWQQFSGLVGKMGDIFEKIADIMLESLTAPVNMAKIVFGKFVIFMASKMTGLLQSLEGVASKVGLSNVMQPAINSMIEFQHATLSTMKDAKGGLGRLAWAWIELQVAVASATKTTETDFGLAAKMAALEIYGMIEAAKRNTLAWIESGVHADNAYEKLQSSAQKRAEQKVKQDEEDRKRLQDKINAETNAIDFLTQAYREGEKERAKFSKMHWTSQTKTVLGSLESMTAGAAQHSKTMFRIHKLAAISNAVVAGSEGVARTLGAYPFPMNIGLAGLHAAAAATQVAALQGTSFGGGSVTSPSGGGASVPSMESSNTPVTPAESMNAPAPQGPSTPNIVIQTVPTPGGEAIMVDSLYRTMRYAQENNIPLPITLTEQ